MGFQLRQSRSLKTEAYSAYALAAFGIDSALLKRRLPRRRVRLGGARTPCTKEVTLPILADDIVRDFTAASSASALCAAASPRGSISKSSTEWAERRSSAAKSAQKLAGGDLNV